MEDCPHDPDYTTTIWISENVFQVTCYYCAMVGRFSVNETFWEDQDMKECDACKVEFDEKDLYEGLCNDCSEQEQIMLSRLKEAESEEPYIE